MKDIDRLTVKFNGKDVGILIWNKNIRRCVFEYTKEWLVDGFSISPLELPLKAEQFVAKEFPFYGNFGVFEDSMPDGYGRYLLNRILAKENIDDTEMNPIQRLAIIGSNGMGALTYHPEIFRHKNMLLPTLDRIQEIALDVLQEKNKDDEELLYFNSGNSGGCRPKCLMKDNEGSWIIKFRHTYDPAGMGIMEYNYNAVARLCGIDVPDFKLIEDKYFATKRYDINEGIRKHVVTAAGILGVSIRTPNLDYKNLLHLTGYMTQNPKEVKEMFRRMAFNVFAKNKDDHGKNFSFIREGNRWELSPAYDLTLCEKGYNNEHATSVNGNGIPTIEDMMAVGESIRISRAECREIIYDVRNKVKEVLLTDDLFRKPLQIEERTNRMKR